MIRLNRYRHGDECRRISPLVRSRHRSHMNKPHQEQPTNNQPSVAQHRPAMVDHWYFAGLNAHRVLTTSPDPAAPPDDLTRFTPLSDLPAEPVDLIFACWSQLVFRANGRLIVRGFRAGVLEHDAQAPIASIIGDHNGIMGALDQDGRLYIAEQGSADDSPQRLACVTAPDSPRLWKVSVAGNFRVSVITVQPSTSDNIQIQEFRDLAHFRTWYSAPLSDFCAPAATHTLPGRTKQLISNQNIWILLTQAGVVYTWGDTRYRGLGRPTTGHGSSPPDRPAQLHSIADETIVKISGGGRVFAALSSTGQVYIWSGSSMPNASLLGMLQGLQPGELAGVLIGDDATGQERRFDDVAVGGGHVLLKCPDGKVFAAGENRNGQLAVDSGQSYYEDWVEIVEGGCSFIRAGSQMSIIRVDREL